MNYDPMDIKCWLIIHLYGFLFSMKKLKRKKADHEATQEY